MYSSSLHTYQAAIDLERFQLNNRIPYYALIMVAMKQADSVNVEKLKAAFPEVWSDLQLRYNAPGGRIGEEVNWDLTTDGEEGEEDGDESETEAKID